MALQRSYNVIFSHFYTAKINVEEYNSLVTSCKAILVEKDKTGFNSLSKIAFDGLILVIFSVILGPPVTILLKSYT